MKQYEVIYSKNREILRQRKDNKIIARTNGNNICSQIFETETLLDFMVALDNFKSREMIYNDTILEIKENK